MFRTTDQDRQNLLKLALPMRREFTATMLDIERLPVTRFEPFVPRAIPTSPSWCLRSVSRVARRDADFRYG